MDDVLRSGTWRLRCGTEVTCRPVQPEDATGLAALMARLSPAARRNRFHGAVNTLSAQRARQMSCVDQQRHVAFVVTAQIDGRPCIVADVRYVIDRVDAAPDGAGSAEFAVVVDERWQRRGVGEHAMKTLMDTACGAGLGWLHGAVLAQNLPMLALMRSCRFCCTSDQDDGNLVRAETSLTADARRPRHPPVPAWRAWMPTWMGQRIGAAVAGHA